MYNFVFYADLRVPGVFIMFVAWKNARIEFSGIIVSYGCTELKSIHTYKRTSSSPSNFIAGRPKAGLLFLVLLDVVCR